jgi:hypothetical protein
MTRRITLPRPTLFNVAISLVALAAVVAIIRNDGARVRTDAAQHAAQMERTQAQS